MCSKDDLYNEAEKYMYGKEVKCNYEKAIRLYSEAAEKGSSRAMLKLAVIYRDGEIAERDLEKSLKYYTDCAEHGGSEDLFRLAVIYQKGEITEKDESAAQKLYKRAAEMGFDKAQNNLAAIYKRNKEFVKAAYWYEKAKAQGSEAAEKNLKNMLEYDSRAIYEIALECRRRNEIETFEKLLRRAAHLNNTDAMKALADIEQDAETAEKLYIQAANQGSAAAAEILGDKYFKTSLKTAEKYYRAAYVAGSKTAAEKLAACYTDGRRLFKNKAKAEKLLKNL